MVRPLIDGDLLRYEVGFASQSTDEEGLLFVHSFDTALEHLDKRLNEIQVALETEEPPLIYLTSDEKLVTKLNKRGAGLEYKPNFREAIAKTKPYKANRTGNKPYHYDNLTQHLINCFDCKLAIGLEADDLLSIDHNLHPDSTAICSRDKDLRITPGLHYGWSSGNNRSFGPRKIDALGYLERQPDGKVRGGGLKFFYSQLLTGDSVDNIPGIPKYGPVKAYKLLHECESEEELFKNVAAIYIDVVGENWRDYFKEQAGLLWMIQELDPEGNPVMHTLFDERQ